MIILYRSNVEAVGPPLVGCLLLLAHLFFLLLSARRDIAYCGLTEFPNAVFYCIIFRFPSFDNTCS